MQYYPVFLDLRDRAVLVVGGGRVASEKVGRLVAAGARVTIVAPRLEPDIAGVVDAGRATWLRREFEAGDTAGRFLVMIATDDGAVNRRVGDEARAGGILVNAADDAANCDFILPAVVSEGNITLAASTAGTSPAMARWLRERLGEWLAAGPAQLADLAADARREARRREAACASRCSRTGVPPPLCCRECPNRVAADRWQEAMSDDLVALLGEGAVAAARASFFHALGLDGPLIPVPWWEGSPA